MPGNKGINRPAMFVFSLVDISMANTAVKNTINKSVSPGFSRSKIIGLSSLVAFCAPYPFIAIIYRYTSFVKIDNRVQGANGETGESMVVLSKDSPCEWLRLTRIF